MSTSIQKIRTRLEKGCRDSLTIKSVKMRVDAISLGLQIPDIAYCNCGEGAYCQICRAKLALLDEIEPLIELEINRLIVDIDRYWNVVEDKKKAVENGLRELKQQLLRGDEVDRVSKTGEGGAS